MTNKGVALVVTDKDTYVDKCMALLNSEEVYKECRAQIESIHSKIVKQLLDLNNSIGYKVKEEYNKLCPPGDKSHPARFCSLPQTHKINIPFRPIVSAGGSSTYRLVKFLTKILQQYYGNNLSFVKDGKGLVSIRQNSSILQCYCNIHHHSSSSSP